MPYFKPFSWSYCPSCCYRKNDQHLKYIQYKYSINNMSYQSLEKPQDLIISWDLRGSVMRNGIHRIKFHSLFIKPGSKSLLSGLFYMHKAPETYNISHWGSRNLYVVSWPSFKLECCIYNSLYTHFCPVIQHN